MIIITQKQREQEKRIKLNTQKSKAYIDPFWHKKWMQTIKKQSV